MKKMLTQRQQQQLSKLERILSLPQCSLSLAIFVFQLPFGIIDASSSLPKKKRLYKFLFFRFSVCPPPLDAFAFRFRSPPPISK